MMDAQAWSITRHQLALEYDVAPEDFGRKGVRLTVSRDVSGRRVYSVQPPAFRMATFGRGLGQRLVAHLRQRVENRGYIPFYGTSSANLVSWAVALGCGFRPAWVEVYAMEEMP